MVDSNGPGGDVWTLVEEHRRHLLEMSLRLMRGNREDAEEAMGLVYLGTAHSLAISLATAAQAQSGLQQIGNAIVGATANLIVSLETKGDTS